MMTEWATRQELKNQIRGRELQCPSAFFFSLRNFQGEALLCSISTRVPSTRSHCSRTRYSTCLYKIPQSTRDIGNTAALPALGTCGVDADPPLEPNAKMFLSLCESFAMSTPSFLLSLGLGFVISYQNLPSTRNFL